jgi:hypothetical protein
VCKKSTARLPSEGKSNNLSHAPTLGHVKDPFSRSELRVTKQNCLLPPSLIEALAPLGARRLWR